VGVRRQRELVVKHLYLNQDLSGGLSRVLLMLLRAASPAGASTRVGHEDRPYLLRCCDVSPVPECALVGHTR
jgi:hypothetical protein